MMHDISHLAQPLWAARTAAGIVLVSFDGGGNEHRDAGDVIALRSDTGEIVAARLIGPTVGDPKDDDPWRIEGRYRVDASGVPISTVVAATETGTNADRTHDWGALGLPNGLDTRVRSADDPPGRDEATLAFGSSGHRILDGNPLLTTAPGDRVTVDGSDGTVLSIDRRKRRVEIVRDGVVTVHEFDDVQTQETT